MTEVLTTKSGFSQHDPEQHELHDKSFVPRRTSAWMVGIAAIAVLVSGSCDSIVVKLMNKQYLPPCDGCEPVYFEAPFFQAWTMYIGEALCLVAFYVDVWIAKKTSSEPALGLHSHQRSFNKPHCPRLWWILPASFDYISTVMVNYAFVLSQASTVQLLRNFNIIVTALLSLMYIRVALRRHQILGVVVVTAGLAITGIYAVLNPDEETNHADGAWIGVVLALVGTVVSAFQFVFEESLFRKYYVSPFEAVGLMGVFGMLIGAAGLLILQLVPWDQAEKTSKTFYMMGHGTKEATILILSNIGDVIVISVFNAAGLTITKFGSGLLRTIIISARTAVVYFLELIIGWSIFSILNFMGLILTILGILVYNYNYMCARGSWKGDLALRRPVMCLLIDPDTLEDPPPNSSNASTEKHQSPSMSSSKESNSDPKRAKSSPTDTF